jgi:hypothetical protein
MKKPGHIIAERSHDLAAQNLLMARILSGATRTDRRVGDARG